VVMRGFTVNSVVMAVKRTVNANLTWVMKALIAVVRDVESLMDGMRSVGESSRRMVGWVGEGA